MFHVKQSGTLATASRNLKEHEKTISQYADRLLWWNEKVNLVSRDVSRETIIKHIEHSLTLSAHLNATPTWIDAGSGGGLPGIPLAIAHPEKEFIVNDIVQKKCTVLKGLIRELGLTNIQVKEGSIADIEMDSNSGVCTKHAFKIPQLLSLIAVKGNQPSVILWLKGFEEASQDVDQHPQKELFEIQSLDNGSDPFYSGKAIVKWSQKP
jgi:16S rRNA (guanine527-N7)-methyltransferase